MRRIDIEVTAAEEEALRRALAGFIAAQRYKRLGAKRQTRLHDAAGRLMEKVFRPLTLAASDAAKIPTPDRGND